MFSEYREHFMTKVEIPEGDPDACWIWTGKTWRGYPIYWVKDLSFRAQRFAWMLEHNRGTNGVWVYPECGKRLCMNPAHLLTHKKKWTWE